MLRKNSRKTLLISFLSIAFAALLVCLGYQAYLMFFPGAVFIYVILLELIVLLGSVPVFLLRLKKNRWWVLALSICGAFFLFILIGGGIRLVQSFYWINHNPDVYADGLIVEGTRAGTVNLSPDLVERGKCETVKLSFRVGENGINQGGGIILRLGKIIPVGGKPVFYDCTYQDMFDDTLQVNNPAGQGYVSVGTQPGVKLSLSKPDAPNSRDFLLNAFATNCVEYRADRMAPAYYQPNAARRHEVHVKLAEGSLKPGEAVEFILGDKSSGGPGWKMPGGEADVDLVLYADEAGDGIYRMVPSYATLQVGGDQIAALGVIAPSTPVLNEDFVFVVKALDDEGFVPLQYRGTVSFIPQEGLDFPLQSYNFQPADEGTARIKARITQQGTYRIAVRDELTGKIYTSNPILVYPSLAMHIYWGDLHQHTTLGKDANRTPEYVFKRNRDVDRLDFAAISIHDQYEYWGLSVNADELKYLGEVSDRYNVRGSFVTIKGYEWTDMRQGHRNIYFADGENPAVVSYASAPDPDSLRRLLEGRRYMVIPHHTTWRFIYSGTAYNWGARDWEERRLVEIYSKHGSSDYYEGAYPIHHDFTQPFIYLFGGKSNRALKGDGSYVREALAKGYRLGIIAGGDSHWARGGNSFGTRITKDYQPGLQAVYAPELTRQSLYAAMWQHHTYATTGARIIVDFKVNGYPMGSEIIGEGSYPDIYCSVKATAPLRSIEIWKHSKSKGYELFNIDGKGLMELENKLTDEKFSEDSFYFVKVIQSDGHLAWSSPVWVSR